MKGVVYQYCEVQKKVVPRDEVMVRLPANVAHNFLNDDMPPTRHPITGDYYTSKARFRDVTRAHGCDEVGNEYEKGYDPEAEFSREQDRRIGEIIHERFRDIINHGIRRR